MTKKKLMEELESGVYCRLKPSRITGVGIFAIRTIPKGTDPFSKHDRARSCPIPVDDIMHNKKIPRTVKKYVFDMIGADDGKFMLPDCGMNLLDISYYLNGSTNPNIITNDHGEHFIAKRMIRPGEELTVDYKMYDY